MATNRARTIPHGLAQLEASGALGNFRNAARGSGIYVGGMDDAGITFPFIDSDVYKWLEAVGWELGRAPDARLAASASEVIDLVAAAQQPDGYLNTYVQLSGRQRFSDLQWGHELYCIGHLVQAAVAWQRALGDDRLLRVARAAIEPIDRELGPDGRDGVDGHPEIEMALVELYRLSGEERVLVLARHLLEQRGPRPPRRGPHGRGVLAGPPAGARGAHGDGPRRASALPRLRRRRRGRGDRRRGAARRRPPSLGRHARHAHLPDRRRRARAIATRPSGRPSSSRPTAPTRRPAPPSAASCWPGGCCWPPARPASRTPSSGPSSTRSCPASRSTGRPSSTSTRCSDARPCRLPRSQVGSPGTPAPAAHPTSCARCRASSSCWPRRTTSGLQLHQYAGGAVTADLGGEAIGLRVETEYPWEGRVAITVERTPARSWTLRLRVPEWCTDWGLRVAGAPVASEAHGGQVSLERAWQPGDRVELELAMPARFTAPDPRVDAVRGTLAVERGPLVYALEDADLPEGVALADVAIDAGRTPEVVAEPDARLGTRPVAVTLVHRPRPLAAWPYVDAAAARQAGGPAEAQRLAVTLHPYYAWANRGDGAMRVWIPED